MAGLIYILFVIVTKNKWKLVSKDIHQNLTFICIFLAHTNKFSLIHRTYLCFGVLKSFFARAWGSFWWLFS